jgi:hypothetical protein
MVGLGLVVFHKQIKLRRDNWNERVPWILRWSGPGGIILTISIVLLGAFLILAGSAYLVGALVQ